MPPDAVADTGRPRSAGKAIEGRQPERSVHLPMAFLATPRWQIKTELCGWIDIASNCRRSQTFLGSGELP